MAHEIDDNALSQLYEVLVETGFDGLGEALTLLLNEVMLLERSHHLQAQPYERSVERRGYANGSTINAASSGRVRIGEKLNLLSASGALCDVYIKSSTVIIKYNDAGTPRYKYPDLSGTGTTWSHSTSET